MIVAKATDDDRTEHRRRRSYYVVVGTSRRVGRGAHQGPERRGAFARTLDIALTYVSTSDILSCFGWGAQARDRLPMTDWRDLDVEGINGTDSGRAMLDSTPCGRRRTCRVSRRKDMDQVSLSLLLVDAQSLLSLL